jgi:hypothetical protein
LFSAVTSLVKKGFMFRGYMVSLAQLKLDVDIRQLFFIHFVNTVPMVFGMAVAQVALSVSGSRLLQQRREPQPSTCGVGLQVAL